MKTAKQKRFLARLKGPTSFPGVGVPGSDVIVTKEPTILMEAQRDALLGAIEKGGFPVSKDKLVIEEVESEALVTDPPAEEPPAEDPPATKKRTRKKARA